MVRIHLLRVFSSFFLVFFFVVRVERSSTRTTTPNLRVFRIFSPPSHFFRPLISRSRGFQPSIPKPPERTRNNVKKRSPDVWADSLSFLRYRGKREKNTKKLVPAPLIFSDLRSHDPEGFRPPFQNHLTELEKMRKKRLRTYRSQRARKKESSFVDQVPCSLVG